MPRAARSRSALGATMIALLPPSSSRQRPKRAATRGPTARPMRVEPVADSSATWGWSTSASPTAAWPMNTWLRCAGASPPAALKRATARSNSACVASAVSGVFSLGFQTTASPQTSASAAFQAHTATGKLKALITPTTPSGCHCSIMRWPGRSLAMVRPCNWRDRPTAKSQMSIISCTSPSPSLVTLPASSVTSAASVALWVRSSSPNRRTSSPRRGAGTDRQARKAVCAWAMADCTSAGVASCTAPVVLPSIGERARSEPPVTRDSATPRVDNRVEALCMEGPSGCAFRNSPLGRPGGLMGGLVVGRWAGCVSRWIPPGATAGTRCRSGWPGRPATLPAPAG